MKIGWRICLFIGIVMVIEAGTMAAAYGIPAAKVYRLDECIQLGFQNNPKLVSANNGVAIAQKEVQVAYHSLYPTLTYGISKENYLPDPNSINDNLSMQTVASIPVYNGGKSQINYNITKLKLQAAQEDKRKAEQELDYQIKTSFYQLWLKQQNLATAQASEDNMGKHYQLVNLMYQKGASNKIELYQAQVQWEEQKVGALTARNQVVAARITLATLIGIDKLKEFTVAYDPGQLVPASINQDSIQSLVNEAYQKRPEMCKNLLNMRVTEYSLKSDEANYDPTVSLSAGYYWNGQVLSEFPEYGGKYWKVLLSISGTMCDAGVNKSRIEADKLNLKQLQTQEMIYKDQIFSEVVQCIQDLVQSQDLMRSNQLNIKIAKQSLELIILQYNNGKSKTSDVKTAQMSVNTAVDGYYQQVVNYLIAMANLDYVSGKDVDNSQSQR